ncbi:UNVERIFIED_CONTAM: hypothetical protein HDU68_001604 [Siphonaria sp. JEL0065]|nr:hypothetical protein HDU68_001604 [Siphonaria sp. JEL0065]
MRSPIQAEQIVVKDSIEGCSRKIVVAIVSLQPKGTPKSHTNLVALKDESPSSDNALAWAIKNILRSNDALVLINVQPKSSLFSRQAEIDVSELILTIDERFRADSHQLLMDSIRKARILAPNAKIQALSLKGDPREVLLEEIEALDANAVVMGSRGLNKVKGVVFGSVSTFLMRHVRACPVIVIKLE